MTEEEREKAEKKRKKKEAQRAKKQLLKEQEQTTATAAATVTASTATEQEGKKEEEGVMEQKETEIETKTKSTKENEPKTDKKPKKETKKDKKEKKERSKKTGPSDKEKDQEAEDNETNLDGSIKVACFTTDFAMQNVLLQLGLKVLATNGYFIRSARQWVLRCLGCHTIHTKDLHRMFCSQCGLHHLTRVAASIDAKTGKLKLHLKKNYHVDTSGMKYSLPSPGKQGRFQGEILLREDQLLAGIWKQKTVKINRDVKSAFGEDVTSEVGLHLNKLESEVFVGWGRSNPNARKGRERRGKRRTTKY
jgi:rRNA maturation endonuclease Nob1